MWPGHPDDTQPVRVALLPPENLSGVSVPIDDVEQAAERALARVGVEVASGAIVDEFLARRRVRYTGGVDRDTARAAREELGVSAFVITSVVLFTSYQPPRFGVVMRLVSAAEEPQILWVDGFGRAGDDAPGLLGLGTVEDVRKLEQEGLAKLSRSLSAYLRDGRDAPHCSESDVFTPRVAFRSPAIAAKKTLTVAVLPFVNESGRRGAGELLALELVRQFAGIERVRVIEPGVVREEMLTYRVASEGGVTPMTARLLSKVLGVDLVVSGVVRDYSDQGTPVVGFSVLALDPGSEEVVFESTSLNDGDDSETLFGMGKVSTANVLSCRMAREVVLRMMQRRDSAAGGRT